ncbi:glycerophosphoryl diester phosphodiesterase membrane domain-containing protein [Nocardiopsis sp. NPDC049922]|uniref:glycerophosphoryl diester phosphodiesterase membrane domain-containing protein n=1 Tax=Nocardiopsis sp. NPDC049922 TaxID=3155157 RepID=UPI00340A3FFD
MSDAAEGAAAPAPAPETGQGYPTPGTAAGHGEPGTAPGYGPAGAAPGYAVPGGVPEHAAPTYAPPGGTPGYGPPGAAPGYAAPGGAPGHAHPGAGHGYRHPTAGRPVAPRPGVVPLRPMTVGDLFNGAFALIRNNPKTTVGLSMIVVAVTSVVSVIGFGGTMADYGVFVDQAFNDPTAIDPDDPMPLSVWSVVATYSGALLSQAGIVLVTGLLTAVVGLAVLGRRLTPGQAWAAVRDRMWAVVRLALTQLLIFFGLTFTVLAVTVVGVVVGVAVMASASVELGIAILVLGLAAGLASFAVFLWIAVRIQFAMPVVVLERVGVFAALARSWNLTRGSWWRVFGVILLTMLLVQVIGGLLTAPFSGTAAVLVVVFPLEAWMPVVSGAIVYVGTVVISAITTPFTVGVTTLLYIDLRMRREGLDLRLHEAARAGREAGPEIFLPEWRA